MLITLGLSLTTAAGEPADPGPAVTGRAQIVDFTRDRVVFDSGAAFGTMTASVPLSGTTDADNGSVIQVRWVAYDDATDVATGAVGAWQSLADTVASGAWAGVLTAPRNMGTYYRAEARVQGSTEAAARTTNRFAAGHVVDIWGQSELARSYLSAFVGSGGPAITDPEALQITICDGGWGNVAAMERRFIDGSTASLTTRLGPLANMLAAERPGEKFHFNMQTLSATGARSLLSDAQTARDWSSDMALRAFAYQDGQAPGLAYQTWSNADAGILGAAYGRFWTIAISGLNDATGDPWTRGDLFIGAPIDHFFSDIYDYGQTKWAIGGPHRYETSSFDQSIQDIRVGLNIAFESPILSDRAVRVLEPLTYRNDPGDVIHPQISVDGMGRFMTLVGYGVLQGLGLAPEQPVLDQWSYDAGTLTIGSSAGPITTTRIAQGEARPSGMREVDQVFVSGAVTSNVSISGGNIVVTGLSDGDTVAVGAGGIGTGTTIGDDNLPALADDPWKDWPIIDLGTAALEGIPVRGLARVPEGLIPAAPLPADSNTNPNLLTAAQAAFDPAQWTASAGWTANGDGTAIAQGEFAARLDLVISPLSEMRSGLTELRFVPTSPNVTTFPVIVTVTSFGGGSTNDSSGSMDLTMGEPFVLPLSVIPAARSSTRIRIEARTSAGTLVINDISVKAVP